MENFSEQEALIRLDYAATKLNASLGVLSRRIEAVEERLRAISPGVKVEVPLTLDPPTVTFLSYCRPLGASKGWRLCVTGEMAPGKLYAGPVEILDARKHIRIAAIAALPALIEAMIVAVDEQYRATEQAVEQIKRYSGDAQ
jgi:hypothetical protein